MCRKREQHYKSGFRIMWKIEVSQTSNVNVYYFAKMIELVDNKNNSKKGVNRDEIFYRHRKCRRY